MNVGNMSQYAVRSDEEHHDSHGSISFGNKATHGVRLLFVAGMLALICAAFLLVAPNVGSRVAVVGALLTGVVSAILVERARK